MMPSTALQHRSIERWKASLGALRRSFKNKQTNSRYHDDRLRKSSGRLRWYHRPGPEDAGGGRFQALRRWWEEVAVHGVRRFTSAWRWQTHGGVVAWQRSFTWERNSDVTMTNNNKGRTRTIHNNDVMMTN